MKPFNLEKALAGEPVMLQDKTKAFIKFRLPNENADVPLLYGYYIDKDDIARPHNWYLNGKGYVKQIDDDNIIGMWEEPRPQVTITIPAPMKEPPMLNTFVYVISTRNWEFEIECITWCSSAGNLNALSCGRVFATKEDAQAFLNALKGARR